MGTVRKKERIARRAEERREKSGSTLLAVLQTMEKLSKLSLVLSRDQLDEESRGGLWRVVMRHFIGSNPTQTHHGSPGRDICFLPF